MTFLTRGGLGYPGSTLPYVGLGRPCEKPTWKPSRMHRYHGGTSSILYNMSNLGSAGKGACWSLADVPAESPTSCCSGQGEREPQLRTKPALPGLLDYGSHRGLPETRGGQDAAGTLPSWFSVVLPTPPPTPTLLQG